MYVKVLYLRGSVKTVLVLAVWVVHVVQCQTNVYVAGGENEAIKDPDPYFMDDPEPKPENIFEKTHYVEDFNKRVRGEEKLEGYMYAGRAEFSWIVDVRFDADDDYELYSSGNILTRRHVITVCRTIIYANYYRSLVEKEQESEISSVDQLRYTMSLYHEWIAMKVIYCANFEWVKILPRSYKEQHRYAPDVRKEFSYEGGEMKVSNIIAHPQCRENSLVYDFATLLLVRDIIPMPPILTYIPIYFDKRYSEITRFDISDHVAKRTMCFVGSFGRPYKNSKRPPTMDYKTKFRVYFTSWEECSKIWDLLGDPISKGIGKPYWCDEAKSCTLTEEDKSQMMCFNTRSRVGSVCDHDRGAPVVCGDVVFGFVTRGAQLKFCSNYIHVPFIAVSVTTVRDYFRLSRFNKFYMHRHKTTPRPPRRWGRKSGAVISKASLAFIATTFIAVTMNSPILPLLPFGF